MTGCLVRLGGWSFAGKVASRDDMCVYVCVLSVAVSSPAIMAAKARSRGPRPKTRHFSPADLLAELTPLLKLRDPGFRWDGSSAMDFSMDRRCKTYKPVLLSILKFAPTGFPAHGDLEAAFQKMQAKFFVLEESGRQVPRMCTDAASAYRAMCKHIYNHKKDGSAAEGIEELIDMISLPAAPAKSSCSSAQDVSPLTSGDVYSMCCLAAEEEKPDGDEEDDAIITHWPCRCPKCMARAKEAPQDKEDVVEITDSPPKLKQVTLSELFGDGLELESPPVPNPKRGAQKLLSHRRLRVKTPDPNKVKKQGKLATGQEKKTVKKQGKLAKSLVKKKPDVELKGNATIVVRHKAPWSGYIMCPKFVCSQSHQKCADYKKNLDTVCGLINKGTIKLKSEAVAKLEALAS